MVRLDHKCRSCDRRCSPMARRTLLLTCLLGLLLASLLPGTARPSAQSRTTLAALNAGVLAELNEIRAAHGLAPLSLSRQLAAAARQHSSEMLAKGYFTHES